jgi:hypothetical protein
MKLEDWDSPDTPEATQAIAIYQCVQLEQHAPDFGLHVALTGGCLYKQGSRKDIDVVLYRIRQVETPDLAGFFARLEAHGWTDKAFYGWVTKMISPAGHSFDFFYPELTQEEDEEAYNNRGLKHE